ncbi:MAG: 4Fe-4S double cluster binding domain-containing protein [Candidatus Thorarchaeota archaeon]
MNSNIELIPDSDFQYRIISTSHLKELKEDFQSVADRGHLSENETFRSYIANRSYSVPESMSEAKSIIVVAVFTPMALVNFDYNGHQHELVVPPQYYSSDLEEEQLRATIQKKIIRKEGYNLEKANPSVLLKRLAVRSGLARYGRNNITYVNEMGSFITLFAYFTNYQFEKDDWSEVKMLDECDNCRKCKNRCITGAIRGEPFVIDAGKCVTLYNEIDGEFPDWIPAEAHNSLMGCMRCQADCPGNKYAIQRPIRLEDVSHDETMAILQGTIDEDGLKELNRKMRGYSPTISMDYFPIFTRNLGVLLNHSS